MSHKGADQIFFLSSDGRTPGYYYYSHLIDTNPRHVRFIIIVSLQRLAFQISFSPAVSRVLDGGEREHLFLIFENIYKNAIKIEWNDKLFYSSWSEWKLSTSTHARMRCARACESIRRSMVQQFVVGLFIFSSFLLFNLSLYRVSTMLSMLHEHDNRVKLWICLKLVYRCVRWHLSDGFSLISDVDIRTTNATHVVCTWDYAHSMWCGQRSLDAFQLTVQLSHQAR